MRIISCLLCLLSGAIAGGLLGHLLGYTTVGAILGMYGAFMAWGIIRGSR